jgi:hypothetical protein
MFAPLQRGSIPVQGHDKEVIHVTIVVAMPTPRSMRPGFQDSAARFKSPPRVLPDERDQVITDFLDVGVVAFQFSLQESFLKQAPHRQYPDRKDRQQSRSI